jgi:hypothetical protein
MARRKTTRRKTTTRRRSKKRGMGAINVQSTLMSIGGVMAGVAVAGYLNKSVLSNMDKNIQIGAPIGLGAVFPMLLKSELGKNIGLGMIAYGGSKLLTSFGLAGIGEDTDTFQISGDDLSVIAGDDDMFAMAGDDDTFAMAGDDDFAMAGDDDTFAMAGDISVLAGIDEVNV